MRPEQSLALPDGAAIRALTSHADRRGDLTEFFRNEWVPAPPPLQWLVSRTEPNALRGVHVHARHWDYYFVVSGELVVGLHDLRATAARRACMLSLSGDHPQLAVVPSGVAHGLYAPSGAVFLVGTSTYYDPADDCGCRWDAAELGFDWPCRDPKLSDRDRAAGGYTQMREKLIADMARPSGGGVAR